MLVKHSPTKLNPLILPNCVSLYAWVGFFCCCFGSFSLLSLYPPPSASPPSFPTPLSRPSSPPPSFSFLLTVSFHLSQAGLKLTVFLPPLLSVGIRSIHNHTWLKSTNYKQKFSVVGKSWLQVGGCVGVAERMGSRGGT